MFSTEKCDQPTLNVRGGRFLQSPSFTKKKEKKEAEDSGVLAIWHTGTNPGGPPHWLAAGANEQSKKNIKFLMAATGSLAVSVNEPSCPCCYSRCTSESPLTDGARWPITEHARDPL